jgi:hypothetical protein
MQEEQMTQKTGVKPSSSLSEIKSWKARLKQSLLLYMKKMHKLLSSYSDSQLAFLLDVMSKTIELTHEESKKLRHSMQRESSL